MAGSLINYELQPNNNSVGRGREAGEWLWTAGRAVEPPMARLFRSFGKFSIRRGQGSKTKEREKEKEGGGAGFSGRNSDVPEDVAVILSPFTVKDSV